MPSETFPRTNFTVHHPQKIQKSVKIKITTSSFQLVAFVRYSHYLNWLDRVSSVIGNFTMLFNALIHFPDWNQV